MSAHRIALEEARLKYLQDASMMLLKSAPATSAYIQSRKQALHPDQQIDSQAQNNGRVCQICGQMLLPGRNCTSARDRSSRKRQKAAYGHDRITITRLECSLCHAETLRESKKPARLHLNSRVSQRAPSEATGHDQMSSNIPETRSGRVDQDRALPRKKARGKKNSLQALLANKKINPEPKSGFGLDFTDLLKG